MRLARILVIGGMGIALGGFLAPAVRADFLHVPASEFTPADGRISYLGGPYVYMSSAAGYMIAPVNLPDRAVVKNIRLFFYDNEPESLELTLIRHNQFNGDRVFMFSIETQAAINFRNAAEEKNVKRIIYLGGLGDTQTHLSTHLRSRMKVAEALRLSSIPTTILRAAIIIGSGSASYEIIKHLTKNIPLLFLPSWAKTKCQPIGIRDVIKYLVGVMEKSETSGESYDIGGRDILTYEMMLKTLSDLLGKRRIYMISPDFE